MGWERLQQRIDEVARNYARTHDPKYEAEVWRISSMLAVMRRVAALKDALARSRNEDMRTAEV
jgi:hypothetical protein